MENLTFSIQLCHLNPLISNLINSLINVLFKHMFIMLLYSASLNYPSLDK